MPDSATLLAFSLAAFLIIVVPGPSVLFVVGRGIALGRRAALATVLGNSFGVFTQVVLVAVGLGALLERSVIAFAIVKFAGAAYLVWLGVQTIRHRKAVDPRTIDDVDEPALGLRRIVGEGYVVGLANPKAIVFLAAILPQFVDPARGPVPVQMLALGAVFIAIATVSDGTWGVAAGSARRWFATTPKRLERLTAAGGAVMVGLGVRLALSRN